MLANIKDNRFKVPGLSILNILSFPAWLMVMVYTLSKLRSHCHFHLISNLNLIHFKHLKT